MARSDGRRPNRPERGEATPSSKSTPRKKRPAVQTNAEESYYVKLMAAKTRMVVILNDGEELQGAIEWYDKGAIKLTREDGPNLLIPKSQILLIFEEKERRRQQRREERMNGEGGERA